EWASERVKPMRVAQRIFHGACWCGVLYPEGDDGFPGGAGALDFPPYVRRAVRLGREDQDKNATGLDRLDDLLTVLRPGGYVAWRHPAADTVAFKARHDSERCCLVC